MEQNFIKRLNIDDFKRLTNLQKLLIKRNYLTENPKDHLDMTRSNLEIYASKNLYSKKSIICFLIDEADFSEEEIGLDYKLLFKQQDCQIKESNLKEDLKSRLDNLFLYFTTDTSSNAIDNFIKAIQFFYREKVTWKTKENINDYKNFYRSLLTIFSQIFDKREDKLLIESINSFSKAYIEKDKKSINDTSLIDELIVLIKGEDPLKSCHSEASRQDSDSSVFVNQGVLMRSSQSSHPDHTRQGRYNQSSEIASISEVPSISQGSSTNDLECSTDEDNQAIKENEHLNHQNSSYHTIYSTRKNNSVEIPSKSPCFSSCWKCLIAMLSRSRNTS